MEGKIRGATFDEYIRVLGGSEHPELFLLWTQEFEKRIKNNDCLKHVHRLEVQIQMMKGKALSKVDRVLKECRSDNPDKKISIIHPLPRSIQGNDWRQPRKAFYERENFYLDVINKCLCMPWSLKSLEMIPLEENLKPF